MKQLQKRQGGMLGKVLITTIAATPALAFSDSQDLAVRDKVNQGLSVAGAAKTLVHDNLRKASADLSSGWTSQRLSRLNPFLDSIRIDPATGVIKVNYTEKAKKIEITLTPSADGSGLSAGKTPLEDINWHCAVSNPSANKYVPDDCRV